MRAASGEQYLYTSRCEFYSTLDLGEEMAGHAHLINSFDISSVACQQRAAGLPILFECVICEGGRVVSHPLESLISDDAFASPSCGMPEGADITKRCQRAERHNDAVCIPTEYCSELRDDKQ